VNSKQAFVVFLEYKINLNQIYSARTAQ